MQVAERGKVVLVSDGGGGAGGSAKARLPFMTWLNLRNYFSLSPSPSLSLSFYPSTSLTQNTPMFDDVAY